MQEDSGVKTTALNIEIVSCEKHCLSLRLWEKISNS